MTFFDLVAICLATFRVSSLIADESGPFNIFKKLRELTGIEHDDSGSIMLIPDKFYAQLISCFWCVSIWVALILYVIWWLWDIPIYILAASGGAMLIDRIIRGK